MQMSDNKFFLALMVVATGLLGWLLYPLYGAVLWGTVIAILFAAPNRMLRREFGGRRNLSAFAMLTFIITLVILPMALIGLALSQQAASFYGRIESGEINPSAMIQAVLARRSIPVYGDGMNVRDWLYVTDHAEALWQVLRRGREGGTGGTGHRTDPTPWNERWSAGLE